MNIYEVINRYPLRDRIKLVLEIRRDIDALQEERDKLPWWSLFRKWSIDSEMWSLNWAANQIDL